MDAVSTYRGTNRRGERRGGQTTEKPAALVGRRFAEGWRELVMTRDGRIVGEIFRHLDPPHRRTWWAESEPPDLQGEGS
jgi:hypothetical protein